MTIEVGDVLVDGLGHEWRVDATTEDGTLVISRARVVVDRTWCPLAEVGTGSHRRLFHLKSDDEPEHPTALRVRLQGWPSSTSEAFR